MISRRVFATENETGQECEPKTPRDELMDGYDLEAIDDNEFVRILRLNRDSNRRALVESRDANRSSIINQAVAAFLKCDDLPAGSARARHPDCKH